MDLAKLTEGLDAAIEAQAFSGVVAIRRRGEALYERAAGYADRSNRLPNTRETRFGIASGTKTFTALAIGKLIAAGQLALDSRLSDCIALDFAHYAPEITIEHLLTHTSGIPDYFDEELITDFDNFFVSVPWYKLRGPRDYLAVFPDEPMKFAPGQRFAYSNGGYILLGLLIEQLTGMRYQEFVEQAILRPAGMLRSGFFAMNQLPEQTALGYIDEAGGWRTNVYNLPMIGASDGGMYTTMGDVDRLWQAFWGYEILPQELAERFAQPHVQAGSASQPRQYGYGLWMREDQGRGREVYLTGCDAGVSFRSFVNRAAGLQVTVLSNTTDGAWGILHEIDARLSV